jgi:predicted nucleic acid-binding protein
MLLDTSGLLCLHNRAEPLHMDARTLYRAARIRVTHSYVLAEFVALAHARRLPRMAALTFISDLVENPDIDMVWVDEALHREAMALLMARPDKTYSLCDAVSFVLMRQRHVSEALTTDHHFEQEGFQRLL